MAEQKILRGKVAEVVSKYEIAINLGRKDGVGEGMRFQVFGQKSIIDPDTSRRLGTYDYPKVQVEVVRVEEGYSVAATSPSDTIMFPTIYDLFKSAPPRRQVLSEKVALEREVDIGDVVIQVKE